MAIIFYCPTEEAFERVEKYSKEFDNILIVDNSEYTEENKRKLSKYDVVTYHSMGGNQGMSNALSYAYMWAIECNIDYLLTMDQDTNYQNHEISKMKQFIEEKADSSIAIYSANYAKCYKSDNEMIYGNTNIKGDEVKSVLFSMTSGSYMNVEFLKSIIPLDDWFIGFVDYDVCASIKQKFPETKFVRYGNSVMYQEVGELVKGNMFNRLFQVVHLSDIRYYYMSRNIKYFCEKYRLNKKYIRIAKLQLFRIYINILFEKNRCKKISCIIKGKEAYKNKELGIALINYNA